MVGVAPTAAAAPAAAPAPVAVAVASSVPRPLKFCVLPSSLAIDGFNMGPVEQECVRRLLGGYVDGVPHAQRKLRRQGPTNAVRKQVVQRAPVPKARLAPSEQEQKQRFDSTARWDASVNLSVLLWLLGLLMHSPDDDLLECRISLRDTYLKRELVPEDIINADRRRQLSAGFCAFVVCLFRNVYHPFLCLHLFPPSLSPLLIFELACLLGRGVRRLQI